MFNPNGMQFKFMTVAHYVTRSSHLISAEEIRESQTLPGSERERGHSVELVDEIIQMYADWVKMDFEINILRKQVNDVQKERKKFVFNIYAKENADELVASKKESDTQVETKKKDAKELEIKMRQKAGVIGNIAGKAVPVSLAEDDNVTLKTWDPQGEVAEPPLCEVLLRLDAMDLERGAKVAGRRGYYLTNDGLDLNQALILYVLDFLRKRGYKKIMPPFFMNKDQMAKTAQLDRCDEELYKVYFLSQHIDAPSNFLKYLIAISEQPISTFHSDERFESTDTPSCTPGIRHALEKKLDRRDVEQFVITDPEKSWETFGTIVGASEEFYQSLGLRYRVVGIRGYKELVSCSNYTDHCEFEVRCGLKARDQTRKVYVHMLNSTLCATERALCCLVENYQTREAGRANYIRSSSSIHVKLLGFSTTATFKLSPVM
ncbi:hypothetical protein CPB83DRAFT_917959 [Crepidotus variabilis]|uniref:Serine-tRNA synthetase type1 N-terminal domain-containing protein n=1 Tax=Crepidotus variabilis TaxID=179855 RepID=A0A9P6E4M0_9AGAR|nr:hypothetical protein CPB83DRAFT_917959 [Crepidotus variabilis]